MMTRTTKRVCDACGCSCDLSDKLQLLAQCVWLLGYRHEDFMNIICVRVNLMVTVYVTAGVNSSLVMSNSGELPVDPQAKG